MGFIILMYLDIFNYLEVENILITHNSYKYDLSGDFGFGQYRSIFLWRRVIYPKNGSSEKMDYNSFRNPPERHGRSGTSDTILDVAIEPFNSKYMLILGHTI